MADTVDDELLVRAFNQGDSSAFEGIVERYSAEVATLANRLLGWPGDVEDVVQEIFIATFLGLKKFRCECRLRTWLCTITANKCRSYRQRRLRQVGGLRQRSARDRARIDRAVDDVLMDCECFERVRRAVRALPARYREAVVFKYLQELPTNEICQILRLSANALQVRLSRARQRLREDLAELVE